MTKIETVQLLAIITAAHPKQFVMTELTPVLWAELLEDIPFEVAQLAVKSHISQSPFPPTIADIRKHAITLQLPIEDQLDAATAWGHVMAAIQQYGYYQQQKALESLPSRTAKVVKFLGWQELCSCTEIGVIRGQFLKMYTQVTQQEMKQAMLPQGFQNALRQLTTTIGEHV